MKFIGTTSRTLHEMLGNIRGCGKNSPTNERVNTNIFLELNEGKKVFLFALAIDKKNKNLLKEKKKELMDEFNPEWNK